jgi:hypothetical protein
VGIPCRIVRGSFLWCVGAKLPGNFAVCIISKAAASAAVLSVQSSAVERDENVLLENPERLKPFDIVQSFIHWSGLKKSTDRTLAHGWIGRRRLLDSVHSAWLNSGRVSQHSSARNFPWTDSFWCNDVSILHSTCRRICLIVSLN